MKKILQIGSFSLSIFSVHFDKTEDIMIFIIAGTEDGRKLAGFLLKNNLQVTASVVSEYGKSLLEQYEGIKINDKKLEEVEIYNLLTIEKFSVLVDASHPYAVNVSKNAMAACHKVNIPYIRYERESLPLNYDKLFHVDDYDNAAKKAAEFGKNIFLTTGSRNLKIFVESPALKDCNIIARVLPTSEVLSLCEKLGLSPKNIVAMQGRFSTELNIELFKHYKADVIVTKDSGEIGGVDTKLEAAKILNLPVILIDRPKINYDKIFYNFDDVLLFCKISESLN